MSTRREARERALSVGYELEVRPRSVDDVFAELPTLPEEYAQRLIRGIEERREELDALIRKYSEHWALERMPLVDRAILRIGAYELGWEPELSTGVIISEAVELAKEYSTKDSGRFVNGMLSRIAEDLRASEAS